MAQRQRPNGLALTRPLLVRGKRQQPRALTAPCKASPRPENVALLPPLASVLQGRKCPTGSSQRGGGATQRALEEAHAGSSAQQERRATEGEATPDRSTHGRTAPAGPHSLRPACWPMSPVPCKVAAPCPDEELSERNSTGSRPSISTTNNYGGNYL